jgi:hypothetical protein
LRCDLLSAKKLCGHARDKTSNASIHLHTCICASCIKSSQHPSANIFCLIEFPGTPTLAILMYFSSLRSRDEHGGSVSSSCAPVGAGCAVVSSEALARLGIEGFVLAGEPESLRCPRSATAFISAERDNSISFLESSSPIARTTPVSGMDTANFIS